MADFITLADLSAAERKAVQGFTPKIRSISGEFTIVRDKVKVLAKPVLDLFTQLQQTHGREKCTLADFARIFDPTVPTFGKSGDKGEGYRAHPVYLALEYMQRSIRRRATAGAGQGTFNGAAARLERMIATVLTIAKDPTPVYAAFAVAFGLTDRAMVTLKKRVAKVEPLIDLSSIVKPVNLAGVKVVHMASTASNVADIESMRGKLDTLAAGKRVNMDSKTKGRKVRAA